jgi:hypothetical protein
VTQETKREIYAAYGITQRTRFGTPGSYEIDHIIPLELGGSNARANLFPEPYPSYIAKDHMENFIHRQVCSGVISLHSGQMFFVRQYVR